MKAEEELVKMKQVKKAAAKKLAAPKKPAAKAAPVKKAAAAAKPVAAKAPAKKAPAKKVSAKKANTITPEQRYRMVQEAAYFIAERHGFNGDCVYFWTLAEVEISNLLD